VPAHVPALQFPTSLFLHGLIVIAHVDVFLCIGRRPL